MNISDKKAGYAVFFFLMLLAPSFALLSNFDYYKDLSGTTSNTTLWFELDTQTLITTSKMKSDCSDIRITDNLDNAIPYWVDYCNDTNTLIYLAPNNATLSNFRIYYGYASATNNEDFNATFSNVYIDNGGFEADTVGLKPTSWHEWDDASGDVDVNNTQAYEGTKSVWLSDTSTSGQDNSNHTFAETINRPSIYEFAYYGGSVSAGDEQYFMLYEARTGVLIIQTIAVNGAGGLVSIWSDNSKTDTNCTVDFGEWNNFKITFDFTTDKNKVWLDRAYCGEHNFRAYNGAGDYMGDVGMGFGSPSTGWYHFDVVRFYEDNVALTVGAEEQLLHITNGGNTYAASQILIKILSTPSNIFANVTWTNGTILSSNQCTACSSLSWDVPLNEGIYFINASNANSTTNNAIFYVNRSITFSQSGTLKVWNLNTFNASLSNSVTDSANLTLSKAIYNLNDSAYKNSNTTGNSYIYGIKQTDAHDILQNHFYLCDDYGICYLTKSNYTVQNSAPIAVDWLFKFVGNQRYFSGEITNFTTTYFDADGDTLNATYSVWNSTGLVTTGATNTWDSTGSTGLFTQELNLNDNRTAPSYNFTFAVNTSVSCLEDNLFAYYATLTCAEGDANNLYVNNSLYCLYDIGTATNYWIPTTTGACNISEWLAIPAGNTIYFRNDYTTSLMNFTSCAENQTAATIITDTSNTNWHVSYSHTLKKEANDQTVCGDTWTDFTTYNLSLVARCGRYGTYTEDLSSATYSAKIWELPTRVEVQVEGDSISVLQSLGTYTNEFWRSKIPEGEALSQYLIAEDTGGFRTIFNLQDSTGEWDDAQLVLKRWCGGQFVTILTNYFDVEDKSIAYLINGESYEICISQDVTERCFGTLDADDASLEKTISVNDLSLTEAVELVRGSVLLSVEAVADTNLISITYMDITENTNTVNISIENYTSGVVLFSTIKTSQTFDLSYAADTNTTYLVRVTVAHATFGNFRRDFVIGWGEQIFLLEGTSSKWREIIAFIILLGTSVAFTMSSNMIAIIILIIELSAFTFWNWLPLPASILWLSILVAMSFVFNKGGNA